MTLDEIRKLAERTLQPPSRDGGPNPTPDLARFAIAVLHVLDDAGCTIEDCGQYDHIAVREIRAEILEYLK